MTIDNVSDIAPRIQYIASAAQTDFDYPFPVFDQDDIVVDVDGVTKTITTHYTVSGVGEDTGGTIAFLSGMVGGEIVTIYRDMAIERLTDFQQHGPYSSDSFNDELDRMTLILQELKSNQGRSLRFAPTAEVTDTQTLFSPLSSWLSKFIFINADGEPEPATGVTGSVLSQSTVGAVLYPQTAAELAGGVTPVNYYYEPGNVLRYGANTAPGTTDMTAAIQAAVNSNALVTVPPADYKVLSTITVPAGVVVSGYGAELICTASQFNPLLLGSGCEVYGLTITGPASATYNASGVGIKCFGTNNSPSAPTFVDGPIIRDCTITNFGIYGIYLGYINGGIIEANTITGIGYAGIGGVSCNDVSVHGNYVATIGPGPNNGDSYGIFIDRLESGNETVEPRSYRCSITDNDVRSVVATGGSNGQGIDTHAGVDFVIEGNRVIGCQVGIFVTSSDISGVPELATLRCTVSGNVIDGLSVGYGIVVSGALDGSTVNEYASQITISNNVILNHGAPNAATIGALLLQATKSCVVDGNSILNSNTLGIHVNLENKGMSIVGNTITDPHDATVAAPMCIRVNGNNNTGLISGNTFVFDNAALDTNVAVRSIDITTSLTGLDLTIGQNQFVGIDATHLTYVEGTSTGVSAEGMMTARGSGTLSGGTLAVSFAKRFPSTPRVFVSLSDALNPVRAHTVSTTGFTAAGTGTDSFTWFATT